MTSPASYRKCTTLTCRWCWIRILWRSSYVPSTRSAQHAADNSRYIEVYVPNTTAKERQDPWISPSFADLNKMKLPPALFTCGTLDPLLDDSLFMSAKWMASGAEAIMKIYPGAPHGFVFFPSGGTEQTDIALEDIRVFMTERT